jgi:hypothetical protein
MSFLFRASDLDPAQRFPSNLLGLFRGIWVDRRFRLQARVLGVLALEPVGGSLKDSTPGSRAKIGMARIGTSPSNPGMGEMKLSKSCI